MVEEILKTARAYFAPEEFCIRDAMRATDINYRVDAVVEWVAGCEALI